MRVLTGLSATWMKQHSIVMQTLFIIALFIKIHEYRNRGISSFPTFTLFLDIHLTPGLEIQCM